MEQPKPIAPETELTIKITAKDYQIIDALLKKGAWEIVNPILVKIEQQVIEQVK